MDSSSSSSSSSSGGGGGGGDSGEPQGPPPNALVVCEPTYRFEVTKVVRTFPFAVAETAELRDEPLEPGSEAHAAAAKLEQETFTTMVDVIKLSKLLETRQQIDEGGGGGGSEAEEELEKVRHRLDLFRLAAMEGELSPIEMVPDGRRQEALGFLVADLVQVRRSL